MTDKIRKEFSYIKQISWAEAFYLLFFAVLFGGRAVGIHDGMGIYKLTVAAAMLFAGIKVLATRHTAGEYAGMLLLGGIAFLVYANTGEKGLLFYTAMAAGMKGVSENRVFRAGRLILGTAFPVLFFLSASSYIHETTYINYRNGLGYILRHSMGYPYPNTFHTTYLILCVLILYLHQTEDRKQLRRMEGILMLGNIYIFLFSISYTGILAVTIYIALHDYLSTKEKIPDIIQKLILFSYPALAAASVLLPLLPDEQLYNFFNDLLHKRIEYAAYFLMNEKLSIFGSRFGDTPTPWYMLDNSYLYLLLQLGAAAFAVVSILYMLYIRAALRENRRKELAIVLTFLFIGQSDPFLFNISAKNLTFIFIGTWLYRESAAVMARMPACFQREIWVLSLKKQIPLRISRMNLLWNRICVYCRSRKWLTTFLISGGVAAAVFLWRVPVPEKIYIPSASNNPYWDNPSQIISPRDVVEIRSKGDLIRDYRWAEQKMYVYEGSAAWAEYARDGMNIFLGSGFVCASLFCASGVLKEKKEK